MVSLKRLITSLSPHKSLPFFRQLYLVFVLIVVLLVIVVTQLIQTSDKLDINLIKVWFNSNEYFDKAFTESELFVQIIDENLTKNTLFKTKYDITDKLWFLTNGSRRLSAAESAQLALWPEESADPYDDRVVNQLMYVPLGYDKQKTKLKSIYLMATDEDWKISLGRKHFLKCPVNSCQFVPKAQAKSADLLFFKVQSDKTRFSIHTFSDGRPPNQIWAKFEIESPKNARMKAPDDSINWTVTYRHDSEVPTPYYKYYPYGKLTKIKSDINYAANKTRKVAWFVSNCYADNYRLEYAKELSKYIDVDIFGGCGKLKCPRSDDNTCYQMLDNDYKFYLSFENSNCLDYITEKFWVNGLMRNVIPVAMGAHPSTYRRLSPPHSYIHVDDFESPEDLANYLHLLDKNDTLYNEYFEWKGTGELKEIYMWCRICALLHSPQRTHTYHNLEKWWDSNSTCVPITWTESFEPTRDPNNLNVKFDLDRFKSAWLNEHQKSKK